MRFFNVAIFTARSNNSSSVTLAIDGEANVNPVPFPSSCSGCNDVYFSLFKPDGQVRWNGNVKKYELCKSAALGCDLGEVLDANGDPAVNATNAIKDEALSFWSTGIDGAEIKVGGAGNEIPPASTRRVYTYTSGSVPALPGTLLSDPAHVLTDGNAAVTKTLLGDPLMSDADRTDLINWIRGLDVDDEDGDTNRTENRYGFNDPLHSSPVAVTYGGTEAQPVIKLFVGTNDGGIRMTNAYNGEEEWIFYPQETLDMQGKTQALTGDLFDVTNVNDPQGADLTALQAANGFFLDFEGNGEKGLASPVILGGTAFFTSYRPEGVVSTAACALAEGSGLLYAINVLNGAAVYPDWDGVDTNLVKGDRTYTLGGGIPSSAVPIFQEKGITLLSGGGGGATTVDPDLALPRQRAYWGQEE